MMAENRQNNILNEPVNLSRPPAPDFSSAALEGSMQQILSMNLGKYVICEFLIGSDTRETKAGILHYVGASYVVLYDDAEQRYMVCDAYPLKFVTLGMAEQQRAQEPAGSDNSGQPNMLPPGNRTQERQQTTVPLGDSAAPVRPLTGIRAVSEPSQVKAAFNYAKRKTRS